MLPALIAVSAHGRRLAAQIPGVSIPGSPAGALAAAWQSHREIVFFGAVGLAVRLAAPLLRGKTADPALVVVDDAGRYVVSLISAHEGGANDLTRRVARQLGAEPVITTASEILADRDIVLGVGCSSGATAGDIEALARAALAVCDASFESVVQLASVDAKKSEPGLLSFADRWHLPLRFYPAKELRQMDVPNPSETVERAVGTPSVAEAAALLASGGQLVVAKQTAAKVTVAIARQPRVGHLAIVGLGPGARDLATGAALDELRRANVVVGYTLYTELVREWLPLAICEAMPLGEEVERARRAIELARAGKRVALVSSGDAGIYALAGLVFEELGDDLSLSVEVLPGITAASSAAALLGAPLMADFAAISLSDLHVHPSVIIQRLEAAAVSDMVAVLYNPASQHRRELLAQAHSIFLQHRPRSTPVGLVRNAYRPDQTVRTVALADLPLEDVDMLTVVVVGSSQTHLIGGRMVTSRRQPG